MTWTNSELSRRCPWTKAQIRQARATPLAPLLCAQGRQLKALPAENFQVADCGDLIVKHSYWRWPSRGLEGNAIDFFMAVEGKTFNQAMAILCGAEKVPENRSELPS